MMKLAVEWNTFTAWWEEKHNGHNKIATKLELITLHDHIIFSYIK